MSKRFLKWIVSVSIIVAAGFIGGYFVLQKTQSPTQVRSTTSAKQITFKKSVNLVAMGDSLTQGVGDQDKNGGYVGIIKPEIEKKYNTTVHASNFGVAGDRSDQILSRLNKEKNFQNKLKSADVIVMTVGGNDLLQSLQKNLFLTSKTKFTKNMSEASQKYSTKLDKLFKTVRKYNPNAPIFLFSVYNPFYVYFANVNTITQSVVAWNSDTQKALSNYGPAYFVNINNLMSHGQYNTKAAQTKLIQQDENANSGQTSQKQALKVMNQKGTNLNKYISTDDNFHPNHLGYKKMSDKLLTEMEDHPSWIREGN
ncbi:SGNH/GDSL hydrolase family protein [Paucilactobacillus suebicus]|uniref:Uncharacterized protein n=1 Tax=Paucilactobacillus suebicus DSM 5007 = KCTC 3549 TaxID=1423807 RepID=A0A0R1W1D2_9LACO|nr:SGNH/GDSL hydrolase family protein [Paucilactobacillus suebicus]KRM11546.1 hypothetical protein FD16_GL000664 [Paucilactobacillus suebicus DSM 5007 = KCTC 3549]